MPSRLMVRGHENRTDTLRRNGRNARIGEREEALQRLFTLLQGKESPVAVHAADRDDSLSRLARLRAARASYGLATAGDMVRVADGAWMRERGNRVTKA